MILVLLTGGVNRKKIWKRDMHGRGTIFSLGEGKILA